VLSAPVKEQIGGWNILKSDTEVVMLRQNNKVIYYELRFCLVDVRFCHRSLSAILRRKIGKPKEEIGNLNGFEYMYLSDLKVLYF
jgi:hypothetical protein